MKTAYKIVAFISTLVLAWWSLREIVERIPPIGKRWWAIVILSGVVAALLCLIGVIKSYHERTFKEQSEEHESELRQWKIRSTAIDRLCRLSGKCDSLHRLLEYTGEPFPVKALRDWQWSIRDGLRQHFGESNIPEFYKDVLEEPQIPDSARSQESWIYSHWIRLNQIIEREHQKLVARKTELQKQ